MPPQKRAVSLSIQYKKYLIRLKPLNNQLKLFFSNLLVYLDKLDQISDDD